jgi:inosine-uridine nucleoside N-ribohydrolase
LSSKVRVLQIIIAVLIAAIWMLDLAPAAPPERIIIDTDSGPFNDDGASLVMVARSPERITLDAVTLVPGNTWIAEGAGYTSRILKLLGKTQIPLLPGAQAPLVNSPALAAVAARKWPPNEYTGAFARPMPAQPRDQEGIVKSAIDYLIESVDRNPGQVTVLALGPMTNLAIAIRLRPDIQSKIRRLVLMGGNVHVPGNCTRTAEFNFWFDPEAARIVLRSSIAKKQMFALDICNQAVLTRARFDEIAAARTPITELYKEDYGTRYPGFYQHADAIAYLWDELATGYLIDPSIVTKSESSYLDVDATFGPNYGAVIPLDRALAPDATPVEVMLKLDAPRAFNLYKKLLTHGSS